MKRHDSTVADASKIIDVSPSRALKDMAKGKRRYAASSYERFMEEKVELSKDSSSRLERAPSAGKRAKAKALLNKQRLRAAAGVVRTFRRAKALRRAKCQSCGQRIANNTQFCAVCGASRSATSLVKLQPADAIKKPILLQRVMAQLIDRLAPLPFLVWFYPDWIWVVGAYHLLCEIFSGRGPGKLISRTRVVDVRSFKKCGPLRAMLRRLGAALGQMAYCRWEWLLCAFAYDLISFLFIWRDRAGQRLEDMLIGTRVISEGNYRKLKRLCAACGASFSVRARFCPQCGRKPK